MPENNEQLTIDSAPSDAIGEPQISPDVEIADDQQPEKRVPVSEAIRYRKRAQAAEKELSELKESHQKKDDELAALKEQLEAVKAGNVSDRSGQQRAALKTQGVKEARTTGTRSVLQNAARQAAGSGSRADLQEYLRLRRNFV